MTRRLLGALLLCFLIAMAPAAGRASAGGWAVTTLDPLPAIRAGEAVPVGFVIRQHGVTPVQLDDVRIEVRSPSGGVQSFDAVAGTEVGRYVADVVFPEAGAASWTVHQGWFGPQELGTVSVVSATTAPASSSGDRGWSDLLRIALPVLALLAAAVAIVDAFRTRRRATA